MNTQIITSPTGERLVVLPEAEFNALVERAEDASDLSAVKSFREKVASGEEELIPAAAANRILDGENPIRVFRELRGMTSKALADAAEIAPPYLSQLEAGKREGTVATMKKIAAVLSVSLDDLV